TWAVKVLAVMPEKFGSTTNAPNAIITSTITSSSRVKPRALHGSRRRNGAMAAPACAPVILSETSIPDQLPHQFEALQNFRVLRIARLIEIHHFRAQDNEELLALG